MRQQQGINIYTTNGCLTQAVAKIKPFLKRLIAKERVPRRRRPFFLSFFGRTKKEIENPANAGIEIIAR